MDVSVIHKIFWSLFAFLVIITSFILFFTFCLYKKVKVKEDRYRMEKTIIQIFGFTFFILFCFLRIVEIDESGPWQWNQFCISLYFTVNSCASLFIVRETYNNTKDPSYSLQCHQKSKYKMKFVLIVLSIYLIAVAFILIQGLTSNFDKEQIDQQYIISNNIYMEIFNWIICGITLYLSIERFKMFKSYNSAFGISIETNFGIYDLINSMMNFIFLSLQIIYTSSFIFGASLEGSNLDLQFTILNYIFVVLSLTENILLMYQVYKSDFYYYTLGGGGTKISCFYMIFGKEKHKRPLLNSEFYSFSGHGKDTSVIFFHSLMGYMIESYSIESLDLGINIALSSIYLSIHKQTILGSIPISAEQKEQFKEGNQNREQQANLKEDTFTTDFQTGKQERLLSRNNITEENFVLSTRIPEEDTLKRKLIDTSKERTSRNAISLYEKNSEKNDFSEDKLNKLITIGGVSQENKEESILLNNANLNRNLKVELESFFDEDFKELMKSQKIDPMGLKASLIAHSSLFARNWNSLLIKNCREEYFKKGDKIVLKTYDKQYNIELVDNNSLFYKENSRTNFLKAYFKHISENKISFLPLIIGIYKIRINNFSPMIMLITRNKLVEDVPKEYFNYWQLLRLDRDKNVNVITSSKDRISFMIKDSELFRNNFKLTLNNYDFFQQTLEQDLMFLREMKSKNFSLMIIYYELGKNYLDNKPPLDDQSLATANVITNNQQRIHSITNNPQFRLSSLSKGNISEIGRDVSSSHKEEKSLFDLKQECNLINFQDNNGFEAMYNEFKCILFFVFDDVFEQNSLCNSKDYYNEYFSEILARFEESYVLQN
jgi:hypothetical protein